MSNKNKTNERDEKKKNSKQQKTKIYVQIQNTAETKMRFFSYLK